MSSSGDMSWRTVIASASDLETTREATRAGFLEQVAAKARKADPYIEKALALRDALEAVSDVEKLLQLAEHRESIVAACGLSIKARGHLKADEEALITQTLNLLYMQTVAQYPDGTPDEEIAAAFREQIVYRYLLTAGDTLGGSMRNYVGALGGSTLSTAILEALAEAGYHSVDVGRTKTGKVKRIIWGNRLIIFDQKPTLKGDNGDVICNNIDICALNISNIQDSANIRPAEDALKTALQEPHNYLACGELKGGIDPGGADEHWKTTLAALDRIRQDFELSGPYQPKLFFVGRAIESEMAKQLYSRLSNGEYSFSANLTKPSQLQALARWLITL